MKSITIALVAIIFCVVVSILSNKCWKLEQIFKFTNSIFSSLQHAFAAPSKLTENEAAPSLIDNTETVPFGMVEDDALCMVKVITGIVEDTDFAASWRVVSERMVAGAERIKACRKNAESSEQEIS